MLTPHCSAASGMVPPPSIASTTRLRKSSEYGFAIPAGLLPAGSLNHIRADMGIPDSAFSGNALNRPKSSLARLWPIFEVADARNAPEYGGTSDFWSVPGAPGTVQKFPSTSEMPAKLAYPLDQNWPKSSLEHFPEKWTL